MAAGGPTETAESAASPSFMSTTSVHYNLIRTRRKVTERRDGRKRNEHHEKHKEGSEMHKTHRGRSKRKEIEWMKRG